MIRYDLSCQAGHRFEAWFRSSGDFDRQAEGAELECPHCGSVEVGKALMAPSVATSEAKARVAMGDPRLKAAIEELRRIKRHVEENSENVGARFPEEARRIHYEEVEKRNIFGEASAEDVRALIDEGIEVYRMPALPEDQN